MNKIKINFLKNTILILITLVGFPIKADIVDASGTRWPIPGWQIAENSKARMSSKQCTDFIKFSTHSKKFLTEGLVIIKDGKLQYEEYEDKYSAETPHILWSVSKTITGALLGIAVRDGKISLDQNLNEFFPNPKAEYNYQKIKIENLFYLDTGFIWDEFYSGDIKKSPVLTMLYDKGHNNITEYAIHKKIIPEGPGYKWNYSTGTPVITMGVLKSIYGSDYDDMPWKSLFNPLGMINIRFERDSQGVFNGGSSAFATPREMAKIGYLYLNKGRWNGKEILPEEWINKTQQVSPGYLSNGTKIRDITDDGVYGGSIWLNRAVKSGFGKPYPHSPDDMFMALGHYGQMIVVLPTEKMVIARTGYDQEYNSKVDEFVSRAIACFDNPNHPIGKNIPPPPYSKTSISTIFNTLKSGLQTNLLQAAVAKTVCSCHFISGLDIDTCVLRSNIPIAKQLTTVEIKNNTVYSTQSRFARFLIKIFGLQPEKIARASFDQLHPEFGCTLK
jgi:CubicO group peptidase (beta-lactamase class C family)